MAKIDQATITKIGEEGTNNLVEFKPLGIEMSNSISLPEGTVLPPGHRWMLVELNEKNFPEDRNPDEVYNQYLELEKGIRIRLLVQDQIGRKLPELMWTLSGRDDT